MIAPRQNPAGAPGNGRDRGPLGGAVGWQHARAVIVASNNYHFTDAAGKVRTLNSAERRVIQAIALEVLSYGKTEDRVALGTLAHVAGLDRRKFQRAAAQLKADGFIDFNGGGTGRGDTHRWTIRYKIEPGRESRVPVATLLSTRAGHQKGGPVGSRKGGQFAQEGRPRRFTKGGSSDHPPELFVTKSVVSGAPPAGSKWPAEAPGPEQLFAQLPDALKSEPPAEAAPIPAPEPPAPPKAKKPSHPPASADERARWKAALDQVGTLARWSATWQRSAAGLELLAWGNTGGVEAWHPDEGAGREAADCYGARILAELRAADPTITKFTVHTPGGPVSVEPTPAEAAA